jgi:hypothetical protein
MKLQIVEARAPIDHAESLSLAEELAPPVP